MSRTCTLKVIHFDGEELLDAPSLSFAYADHPWTRLMEHVAQLAIQQPRFQDVATRYVNEHGEATLEPAPGPFEIELVFISNREVLEYWDVDRRAMGVHTCGSGPFEARDGTDLASHHRIVVVCNPEETRRFMVQERLKELDPLSHQHDTSYIAASLITLTHELVHCIELMEHGNGWTPFDLQGMHEGEEIDLSLYDLSSGHGILFPFDGELSVKELEDIMERRVEDAGRELFYDLAMDSELFEAAYDSVCPSDSEVEQALARERAQAVEPA